MTNQKNHKKSKEIYFESDDQFKHVVSSYAPVKTLKRKSPLNCLTWPGVLYIFNPRSWVTA